MAQIASRLAIAAIAVLWLANCSQVSFTDWFDGLLSCGFNQQTIGQLRVGLSYQEVTELTGCRGEITRKWSDETGSGEYRKWPSPSGSVFVQFENSLVKSWKTD